MKPFLTWTGSKYRLLNNIRKFYPETFNNYYEPFLGSGAVFFDLYEEQYLFNKKVFLSDKNPSLVSCYLGLQRYPSETWQHMMIHVKQHSKEYFNQVKNKQLWTIPEIAGWFLYINKASISGIYRENSNGGLNTTSRIGNVSFLNQHVYNQAIGILQNVQLQCIGFEMAVRGSTAGDFVYFDPPYQSWTDKGSRAIYNKDDFTFKDQKVLYELCCKLDDRGVKFLCSNSASENIYMLFEDKFRIETFDVTYNLGTGRKADKTKEVLIMNY